MGYGERITQRLDPVSNSWPYAVGQGCLGLECRMEDSATQELVSFLDDAPARAQCQAERAFLRHLEGGCQVAVGVVSENVAGGEVKLSGSVWNENGSVCETAEAQGGSAVVGKALAAALTAQAEANGNGQVISRVADPLRRALPVTEGAI